jgi:hypothetical protein
MIALNAADFGNFITHPLMRSPSIPGVSTDRLDLIKEGTSIDPSKGTVTFFGTYLDAKWKFTLKRGPSANNAIITATPYEIIEGRDMDYGAIAPQLTEVISRFFNEMVLELGGTFLSFGDLMVTAKGKEPSVLVSLGIKVIKLPSSGLEF